MEDLCNAMSREIKVMRELLASMHLEQKALLKKDCACLSLIKEDRTALIESMRKLRFCILHQMDEWNEESESEFFILKDQIMTLVEKIHSLRRHNRALEGCPYQPMPLQNTEIKPKIRVQTLS